MQRKLFQNKTGQVRNNRLVSPLSTNLKDNTMNNPNTYIKITDDVTADTYSPSEDELKLDKFDDIEYNSPYIDDYSDVLDVGGVIEAGSIFDDR